MRPLAARVERQRLGAFGLVGTGLLHASLLLLVVLANRRPPAPRLLPAYRVDLVAAPRAAGPEPGAAAVPPAATAPLPAPPPARTLAVARTAPSRSAPAPRSAARPSSTASAAEAAKAPAATTPPGAARAAIPVAGGSEGAMGGTGADPATIRTEGVEFPFPGYLRNLVAQVFRRWRPPPGNSGLEAEIVFLVHRDGSISGLTFVRRSGSFGFDLEAQGAVEAAARAGAFGALPSGYGSDMLPVSFFFSPRSLR